MQNRIIKMPNYKMSYDISPQKERISFTNREMTYMFFNSLEQNKKYEIEYDIPLKIIKRIKDLNNSFYEENKELPKKSSKDLFIKFLKNIKPYLLPSITLTPKGFFTASWDLKNNKIVLCFNDDNYIEYLFLTNIKGNASEIVEGNTKIENLMEYFEHLLKKLLNK
jgi:hypothetical protein